MLVCGGIKKLAKIFCGVFGVSSLGRRRLQIGVIFIVRLFSLYLIKLLFERNLESDSNL